MKCPECEAKTETTQTRSYRDPSTSLPYVERYRRCLECGYRFKSIEARIEDVPALLQLKT